jgi:CRISPR system Cascade subunit CasE
MNAWLARIELNLRNPQVRADLSNVNQLHKRVMMLAPDDLGDNARHQTGVLFRLDQDEHTPSILVQARIPLDTDRLPAGYGRTQVKDLAPMFSALTKNQGVNYRIAANASKRLPKPDPAATKRGSVIALHGAAAEDWWRRHAHTAGLTLLTITSSPVGAAHGDGIRHDLTQFDGTAVVHDPHALAGAVLDGIGRGKAYGAGLLSLAPARLS